VAPDITRPAIPDKPSLDRFRSYHEATIEALRHSVEYAIDAGNLLLEAKEQLKHGQWLPWLAANCTMSERTAQLYMRLARNRAAIEDQMKSAGVADLTLEQAAALIAPMAPVQSMEPVYQFAVQLAAIDSRIKLTPTSLKLPDDLSFEKWSAVGQLLKICFGPAIAAFER
jgi:hypothetical protein